MVVPSLDIQVGSSTTIFPESKQGPPTTIPLSIIDSTVSWFSRCAAIWFFDPTSSPECTLTSTHLQSALSITLNAYPQWCGLLTYAKYKPNAGHTNRYRRVQVTFNAPTDIGIPFITATSPKILSKFLPDNKTRASSLKSWDASKMPTKGLYPPAPLSLNNNSTPPDAPNVVIQLTTFACGSTAISINITHCLADAQTLSQFAKDFSSVARSLFISSSLPTLTPLFSPHLIDDFAAGDIDAETPDPDLIAQARKLPRHRYDNYTYVEGQPGPDSTPPDFETVKHLELSESTPIPWEEWDWNAPCSHRVLHFSEGEIQRIYNQAISPIPQPSESGSEKTKEKVKISKLDTLLAHIWTLINTARSPILPLDTPTYLDLSLGLRPRISPPLPENFIGSPLINAAIPFPSPSTSAGIGEVARCIKSTINQFTPEAIKAQLHDLAFEVSPQRLWGCFLGKRHVLCTSWLYLRLDEVDFIGGEGTGGKVKFVWPVMPSCDGLVDVLETVGEEDGGKGHWSRNGVDVSVYLEESVMGRLLGDGGLFGSV